MFNATSASVFDVFATLRVLRFFGFQVSEGNLWAELDVASKDTTLNLETGNGDVEVSVRSEYTNICPVSGNPNQQNCWYLRHEAKDPETTCNLNLSVHGQVILRDVVLDQQLEIAQFSEEYFFHNQTLDALAALAMAIQGTSYVVLTSGNPHRSAFLKPRTALRYVVLPSQSFGGAR